MRLRLLLAAFAFLLLLPSTRADALMRFGTQEEIRFIQDVRVRGPNNEQLFLGYMTRTENFIGGLYVKDGGYVLGVRTDSTRYFHLPTGAELTRLQRAGDLPDPLPRYKLSRLDYVMGFSAYWIAALALLFWWFGVVARRAAARSEQGNEGGWMDRAVPPQR